MAPNALTLIAVSVDFLIKLLRFIDLLG
jgi:hypothetical protein